MDLPPGLLSQGPLNHPPQVPMLTAGGNPQAQLNAFLVNGTNSLNQPPFMSIPSLPNASNVAAFNALLMQSGLLGVQMPCQPSNFSAVAGLPFQGQLYNTPNLSQIAGQQFQGQFNLQGLWPQTFPPNMNQITCLLQGQMNSQNVVAPMNNILPQQCSTNPFGSNQATTPNNHMFSQYTTASPSPNSFLFGGNSAQLQAIDQQGSATAIPQNSQSQFGHLPQLQQNLKNSQRCQEIVTKKSDKVSDANFGREHQTFVPSPRGNWKKEISQTRFVNPRSTRMANGRGGMRPFNRNQGLKNRAERNPNTEIFDNQPREPRRRLALSYTEEEIRQWREARRKNYPTASKTAKKMGESCTNPAVNDEDAKARRKQLRDIIARQVELGVEVAELPHNYLSDTENQYSKRDHRSHAKPYNRNDRFQNKFNKRGRSGRGKRYIKRHKSMNSEFPAPVVKRPPTLLRKLLSSDIKKDKCKLLQVFRFITLNSFFEHLARKTLVFPQVTAKDAPFEGDTGIRLHSGADGSFDTCKIEDNLSDKKDLAGENVVYMSSDEDIGDSSGGNVSADDSSESDDSELSGKFEEGEIGGNYPYHSPA